MKRKLVKQGAATLMISLPAKWIKKNSLDKGSEIDLEETSNALIIKSEAKEVKKQTEINLSSVTESSIRVIITHFYRLGYDKIKVNFQKKESLPIIQKIVDDNLVGFEISKVKENSCMIESITEPSADQFDNIFSKVFMNIEELFNLAEKALNGEKADADFEMVEKKILQYDNFCRRVISRNQDYENKNMIWTFHSELMHAQRNLYLLLEYIGNNKIKPEKEMLELLKSCKEIYELVKKAYYEKDMAIIERMHEKQKQALNKKAYELLKKSKEPIVIHYLLSSARNFYLTASSLINMIVL